MFEIKCTMIRLISHEDRAVEFPRALAREIAFVRDAFDDIDSFEGTTDIHVHFLTEAQLLVLKRVLLPKVTLGASFIPTFGGFKIGTTIVSRPPFTTLCWDSCLDEIFHSLVESQIVDLLLAAQGMCMWDLRKGVIYLMIHRLLKGRCTFTQFFETDPYLLTDILVKMYKSALTNVDHNDCYVLPGSSGWD